MFPHRYGDLQVFSLRRGASEASEGRTRVARRPDLGRPAAGTTSHQMTRYLISFDADAMDTSVTRTRLPWPGPRTRWSRRR